MTDREEPHLALEIMEAILLVSNRHQIKPREPAGCMTLVKALGEVLMAIVVNADHEADGVLISKHGADMGTLVTVHSGGEYLDVKPQEKMQ